MRKEKLFKSLITGAAAASLILSMAGMAAADEPVTITFWDMVWGGPEYATEAQKLAESYSEVNPNVVVEYQSIPWANRYETFSVAIASGEGPDVSTGGGYQQHQFAATGDILYLNDIIEEWEADGSIADFPEGFVEFFQDSEGNQLGIPFNFDGRGMYIRKDIFEEKGVAIPTTWDELYDACVALTDPDNGFYALVYAASDSGANVTFMSWLLSNGGGVWAEDGITPDWTSEENLETLNFITKLKEANAFPEGMASYEASDAQKLFLQGNAAMLVDSIGVHNDIEAVGEEFASNVEIIKMPVGPSADEGVSMATAMNSYMVYNSTEHPEEAKEFIKWWSENNLELWTGPGNLTSPPARISLLNDPSYSENRFIAGMLEKWVPEMRSTMYPASAANLAQNTLDAERWWRDISQACLIGERTNEQILQDKQDAVIELIDDLGL